jgi:hypothetical protein
LHPSQGVIPEVLNTFVVARWNDPEHLRQRVKEHHGQIAAIIFEPVLCNTGCMPPVPGMIDTIRELCDENGIVMIADETITGFRFGAGCAQTFLGFTPDLTILGKAVGGGVPFAALVGKEKFFAKIISGQVVQGSVLLAFGVLVIGLVDNILRPILVGKDTKMPDYVVLLSTLGGISMFGINGFVIGPVIAAMCMAAWSLLAASQEPD